MGQMNEMVELMVEAVCSKKKNLRVAGNDFPQAVVKSRTGNISASCSTASGRTPPRCGT